MSIDQLRIFAEIGSTGNISSAAAKLYISHSTVSRALKALEEELGTELVYRGENRCHGLTPEGKRLYPEACEILTAIENLPKKIKGTDSP